MRIPDRASRTSLPHLASGLIALIGISACTGNTPASLPDGPGRILTLTDREIDEASGLAVSRAEPGRLWLHNDSSGAARLYASDHDGRSLGSVDITGVTNTDWEDLAAYSEDDNHYLLIADVGDNRGVRPTVQLHVVSEPITTTAPVSPARTLNVTYPDGPRDCEAVAVDETERAVYLLSKRDAPPRLYRVPLGASTGVVTAEFLGAVGSIPQPTPADRAEDPRFGRYRSQPTAMSFSAAADRALVVTYKDAYLYTRVPGEPWLRALNRAPRIIDLPQLAQTEAGDLTAEGNLAFVASERLPAALVEIPLP